jgi:hypothetical protein
VTEITIIQVEEITVRPGDKNILDMEINISKGHDRNSGEENDSD